jgi:hypothetical protein
MAKARNLKTKEFEAFSYLLDLASSHPFDTNNKVE